MAEQEHWSLLDNPQLSWSWKIKDEESISSFLYFISDTTRSSIKIGISTNPERRVRQLQTGNSSSLHLLGYRKGEQKDEKMLHRMLSAYNENGEWYEDCLEVRSIIEELITHY